MLTGLTHEAILNVGLNNTPMRVITAWVASRGEATRLADSRRAAGAELARVFKSGREFRVVAWFPAGGR
jgi:hypothetical protein